MMDTCTLSSLDYVRLFLDNIFSYLSDLATHLLSAGDGLVIMLSSRLHLLLDDAEGLLDCAILLPAMGTSSFQSSVVLIES